MKDSIKVVLIFVTIFVGVAWLAAGVNYSVHKYYDPKEEVVRRETFEQSKAYNDGMQQELANMQFEYVQAKPEQKMALASIILHRVAAYDVSKLSPDLRQFIQTLRTTP